MIENQLCLNNSPPPLVSHGTPSNSHWGSAKQLEKLYADWRGVYSDDHELFGNGLYRCVDLATLRIIKLDNFKGS